MTELPQGWLETTLGEVALTSLGKMLDAKQATGEHPTPYLRNINVRWGSFDLDDVGSMDIRPEELERVLAREGDVIACEGGEPGRAAVWRSTEPVALQKALHRIRPSGGIVPEFIAFALRTQASTGELATLYTGTTIKHLPQEKLRLVRLSLAPLAEQHRIVAAIDEAFSKLDAGEAGLRATQQRLKRMRDSALAAAVSGQLVPQDPDDEPAAKLLADLGVEPIDGPSVPPGWARCRLTDVSHKQDYGVSHRAHNDQAPSDVAVLRMGNIQAGEIDTGQLKFLNPDMNDLEGKLLDVGDVLFNRTNSAELVGKTAVYDGLPSPSTFASYLIRVRCNHAVLPRWTAFAINSRYGRRYLDSVVTQQVGQANVNGTKLKAFPIPLPPLAEQHRIVAEVERQFSFIEAAERAVEAALARSAALRRSVLKAAFEGKLVPQDPRDEPASVLLERIRAERTAAGPPKRRARKPAVSSP